MDFAKWIKRMMSQHTPAQPHARQSDMLHASELEQRLDSTIARQAEAHKTLDELSDQVKVLRGKSRRAAGAGFT